MFTSSLIYKRAYLRIYLPAQGNEDGGGNSYRGRRGRGKETGKRLQTVTETARGRRAHEQPDPGVAGFGAVGGGGAWAAARGTSGGASRSGAVARGRAGGASGRGRGTSEMSARPRVEVVASSASKPTQVGVGEPIAGRPAIFFYGFREVGVLICAAGTPEPLK